MSVKIAGLMTMKIDTQTETDPTSKQWLALHHAFRRYCGAKPWERLANEDVLASMTPWATSRDTAWRWVTGVWPTVWEFTWVTGAS